MSKGVSEWKIPSRSPCIRGMWLFSFQGEAQELHWEPSVPQRNWYKRDIMSLSLHAKGTELGKNFSLSKCKWPKPLKPSLFPLHRMGKSVSNKRFSGAIVASVQNSELGGNYFAVVGSQTSLLIYFMINPLKNQFNNNRKVLEMIMEWGTLLAGVVT